jgi:hypothetical protein
VKSKTASLWTTIAVVGVVWVVVLSGCEGQATQGAVSATKDQLSIWNDFATRTEENDYRVVFYTREQHPIRSLEEIVSKDQFGICAADSDYVDLVLRLLGYEPDDVYGLQVLGGRPETLEDPNLRLYLAYEAWEEELRSYGWIRVQLVEQ